MATGLDLSGIQQFSPYEDPTTLSNCWTVWLKRFERFVVAMDIKDTTRKRSLLLYLQGRGESVAIGGGGGVILK